MDERCVLLVEDDVDLRTTLAGLLREEGLTVAEAESGADAMDWMHAHGCPRVILLDLMMPKMDGIQFRRAQLAEPELAKAPVVLMTASTLNQQRLDAARADEVLRKPVQLEKILSVLRRYV